MLLKRDSDFVSFHLFALVSTAKQRLKFHFRGIDNSWKEFRRAWLDVITNAILSVQFTLLFILLCTRDHGLTLALGRFRSWSSVPKFLPPFQGFSRNRKCAQNVCDPRCCQTWLKESRDLNCAGVMMSFIRRADINNLLRRNFQDNNKGYSLAK